MAWHHGWPMMLAMLAFMYSHAAKAVQPTQAGRHLSARGTGISNSILLTGFYDFTPKWNGLTTCQAVIQNSKGLEQKKIAFVVTALGVGDRTKLYRYYYRDENNVLVPVDKANIQTLRKGLVECFQAGVAGGFTTFNLLPHVDPIDRTPEGGGIWRNIAKFDPAAKYGPDSGTAFTYEDVLIQPIVDALNDVSTSDIKVEFTISGESGLSLWSYPRAYRDLLRRTKPKITKAKDVIAGVAINFDKVCGCVEPDEEQDALIYNATYLQRFQRFQAAGGLSTVDVQGVREVFDASDFIGLSAYAPMAPPESLTLAHMETAIQTAVFEMQPFGIDLGSYFTKKGKQLFYSEQGVGGDDEMGHPAPDLEFVWKKPYRGGWPHPYKASEDPWRVPAFRDYRRQVYRLMSVWAAMGVDPSTELMAYTYGAWEQWMSQQYTLTVPVVTAQWAMMSSSSTSDKETWPSTTTILPHSNGYPLDEQTVQCVKESLEKVVVFEYRSDRQCGCVRGVTGGDVVTCKGQVWLGIRQESFITVP